jgi:hypothetical protein
VTKTGPLSVARRYRRGLAIAAVFLAVYSLAGFLLLPMVAARQLPAYFRDALGLQASIERLRINPFALTLRAEGFLLREAGGAELLRFDELFVNFQLSSLFRWAWTFKEVRLSEPRIEMILRGDGSLNLAALVPPTPEPVEEAPVAGEGGLPRVIIHRIELQSGRARLEDGTRPTPFRTMAGPMSITLTDFSTLPGASGPLAFEAELESGARLTWQGTVGVNPVRSAGHLRLTGGHMPITKRYLQDLLRFQLRDGRSDFDLDYTVAFEGEETRFTVSDGSIVARDVVVTPEDDEVELLRLPEARIAGISLEWPGRVLAVDEIALRGARLAGWRAADGTINLLEPLAVEPEAGPGGGETVDPPAEGEAGSPLDGWRLSLGRLVVDDFAAAVEDRTVDPPLRTGLSGLRLEIGKIDNAPGSMFPVTLSTGLETGGTASAEGRIGLLPVPAVDAAVKVSGLSLVPLQAYAGQLARLRIDSGLLSLDGRLTSDAKEKARYRGRVDLADVACHDIRRDERLLGIGRMSAADLLLELTAARLRTAGVSLERPSARLTIHEDGSTNVGDVLSAGADAGTPPPSGAEAGTPAPSAGAAAAAAPALALQIEVGEVRIRGGAADFADLSLPLPFASRIESLEGSISEMVTGGKSARVDLQGDVDEHGLARVEGSLDMFAPDRRADMAVAFRNVEMSRLSPYASKFAGYEVERGRLSLDLRYLIEDRRLASQNEILIDELTLGRKVESPDAIGIPVKLAVAMLKDKNGRIDLDIPIEGTLDDPQFAYGKLVWQAIKTVMTKLATAPFRALARLIGTEKDLEFVEFAAADSDISPPSRETLEQLARALAERPELHLEVQGVFDPEIDAAALRERKVDALVAGRLAAPPEPGAAEPTLASERQRAALEALFLERFPREEMEAMLSSHTAPPQPADPAAAPSKSPPPVLDLPAYLDGIRERLIGAQEVSGEEMALLADARAAAIGGFFSAGGGVAPERVRTVASGPIPKKDAGSNWVRLRLVLGS